MLDKESFQEIREKFEQSEERREEIIQGSRKIIKLSKQIIYALHRGEEVEELLEEIKEKVTGLKRDPDIGISNVAVQEYVEAASYHSFLKQGKIPTIKELEVDENNYLLGLCDLTGELGRKAVAHAIKGEEEKVVAIKELVEELYGEFLKFDFRNGELRKKSDAIKWNLNKLQDLVYSLKKGRN